jgi:phosphatidylglycerol:prolipoprotein diacylglycerol transferase
MNPLCYIKWAANPEIASLGPLSLRWYGILFCITFLAGVMIMRWVFRKEGKPSDDLAVLLLYMMIGTIVGARLGHCLFYHPGEYLKDPLKILATWKGGLSSHGAAICITIALLLYTLKRPGQGFIWLGDRMMMPVALGACLIRIGNFVNSEILGKATEVPWAVIFARVDPFTPRHPVQLYEAGVYAILLILLVTVYRRFGAELPRGLMGGQFLTIAFGARFVIEFYKRRLADHGTELPLSMGQWLSIPLVLVGIAMLVRTVKTPRPDVAPVR